MIGRRLSHYRILDLIGQGGMGIVYRARDERLQRDVALKVLSTDTLASESSRIRFRKEALTLSRLSHPRIGVIHDFDSQDGIDFLVMELVPGRTLADRIREGPLPERDAVRIASQIADALEAAHEAGVVHWDLKPGNVLLTGRGDVKVVDFGLARKVRMSEATTATASVSEHVAGTAPYMAPEQILGGAADARVDLWALGVVLYEMTTGRRPFEASDTVGLLGSILHAEPRPPRALGRSIPVWLEALILRCLRKNPAHRYPSAAALQEDLRRSHATPAPVSRRALVRMVASTIVVIAGVALASVLIGRGCRGGDDVLSLAVLPLVNLSGDPTQEFFADGMTEEVTTALSHIRSIRVISRTSAMRFKRATLSVPEIARRLGVDAVVQGTVRRTAALVRISAQLVDAGKDEYVWSANFERPPENILALQNDIAQAIANQIQAKVTPQERERLASTRKVNPEAHEAYLRARYYSGQSYSEEDLRRSVTEFRRAIDLDPGLVEAYAGLAQTYTLMANYIEPSAEAMPKARALALQALQMDSTHASAHSTAAYVRAFFDWEWEDAERAFGRAIALNPSDPVAHRDYGNFLVVNARFDEAIDELDQASRLDPLSTTIGTYQLFPLYEGRRYEAGIRAASRLLEADSSAVHARFIRAQCYLAKGDTAHAVSEMERCYRDSPHPFYEAFLGYIDAARGRTARALRSRARMEREFAEGVSSVHPYGIAILCLGLGDKDGVFRWLERCVEGRAEESAYLNVDPIMDPVRSDPRYRGLLRRVGFKV